MRVVFFGSGDIGRPALEALCADPAYDVRAVFTQPDRPAGRKRALRASPIKEFVAGTKIPLHQPERIRDQEGLELLRRHAPDVIVVAAYGQILPSAVLRLPRYGCLNIHASLLPRHRGASPVQAAILSGDAESGITIMQMDEGLDTGAIWVQESLPIDPEETAGQLHDRLGALAPGPLLDTLERVGHGSAKPVPQDDDLATYAPKLRREDGALVWGRTARELNRQIRGLSPWPGAHTTWPGDPGRVLKIHKAEVVSAAAGPPGTILDVTNGILVAADGGGLRLQEVQFAGGRRLRTEEFLRGNPLRAGETLG